jgi:hypothetical protein
MQVEYPAIIVSTLLAVAFSAVYYFLLNKQVVALRMLNSGKKADVQTKTTPNKILIELVRTFVIALVVANAVVLLNLLYLNQAVLLAFWLWVGFPVVFLAGLVINEHFPGRLAAIHAGDWLGKLLIICIILTLWR